MILSIVCTAAVVFGGCTTALKRTDNSEVKGRLVDSDAARKTVQMRFDDGTTQWIGLDTVKDVDPAGTHSMWLGGAYMAVGLLGLTQDSGKRSGLLGFFESGLRGMSFTGLIGGAIMFGSGLYHWREATAHLDDAGWPP